MMRVVERIRTFNTDRDPAQLKQKYQAMQTNAFAFLRGTCHLFYEDWPADTPLNETPPAWICGDLHVQNLGSYKGDNRIVYFSINDFDESALAPCTWDLARLLTSLLVAAHTVEIKRTDALALCRVFLEVYTDALLIGRIQVVDEERAVGVVRKLLSQVEKRHRTDFLNARTTLTAQGRMLRINGKQTRAVIEQERATVTTAIESLSTEPTAGFFKVLDVAHRVAGVGSLGIDRYVVLVEGRGSPNQNYLLDVKAVCSSSLQPYLKLKQPNWDWEAERSAMIRRWVQGIPPALLSDIVMNDQSYVLRELQPTEDKVNLGPLCGKMRRLEQLVRTTASVVAWGQLRSGGIRGSATVYDLRDFAKDDRWQKALLSYIKDYARKVEQDYQEFAATMKDGAWSEEKVPPTS
jgi:uncharacterized protein (DUF2252 family)